MADISSLNLNPASPVDWEGYKDGGEYRRPPVEGKYFLQVPSNMKVIPGSTGEKDTIVLTANKEGVLTGIIDGLAIVNSQVEGANGYKASRVWIDTKKNPYREGTSMGDYLRANSINPTTSMKGKDGVAQNPIYASLVEQTQGRIVEATTRWEGRCSDCDEKKSQYVGMASFPKDENGQPKHIVQCKHCKKDVFAQLRVRTFISKVKDGAAAVAKAETPTYA